MSRFNLFIPAGRTILAALLAGWLIGLGLLAASGAVHRAFHHGGHGDASSCIVCLLAQGQVKDADAAPALSPIMTRLAWTLPALGEAVLPEVAYLASPSRAPPASFLFHPVVA